MQRIISVAAVLSLLVALAIWANVVILARSLPMPTTSIPFAFIPTAIPTPALAPINAATPSCVLGPKDAWDKMLRAEEGAWTGHISYTNYYLKLSVNVLGWAGVGYGAEVTIENSLQDAWLHISPLSFQGIDSAGRACGLSAWHWEWEKALQATDLEPGSYTSGRVIIDCPEADPLAYIIYDDGITLPIMINVGEILGCH